ncbi:MAG: tetratricopeptide repeat protein [Thermosynechococcaceae cyanobacterium]
MSPDLDPEQQQMLAYQAGQALFERGQYRESVEYLTQAQELGPGNSRIGGEIQMWLVTAYEAAGQREEALALCRRLTIHPYAETRKQSKRLLYILEAPKLELRPEWLTQIPDLKEVTERDQSIRTTPRPASKPPAPRRAIQPPADLSQVETDNGFLPWIAVGAIALTLISLFWPS